MAALEVVAWLVVLVLVPVLVPEVVKEWETVVPKPEVVITGLVLRVAGDVADDVTLVGRIEEEAPVLAALGPMLKVPVVA